MFIHSDIATGRTAVPGCSPTQTHQYNSSSAIYYITINNVYNYISHPAIIPPKIPLNASCTPWSPPPRSPHRFPQFHPTHSSYAPSLFTTSFWATGILAANSPASIVPSSSSKANTFAPAALIVVSSVEVQSIPFDG